MPDMSMLMFNMCVHKIREKTTKQKFCLCVHKIGEQTNKPKVLFAVL